MEKTKSMPTRRGTPSEREFEKNKPRKQRNVDWDLDVEDDSGNEFLKALRDRANSAGTGGGVSPRPHHASPVAAETKVRKSNAEAALRGHSTKSRGSEPREGSTGRRTDSARGSDAQQHLRVMGAQIQQGVVNELRRFGGQLQRELLAEIRLLVQEVGGRPEYPPQAPYDLDGEHGYSRLSVSTQDHFTVTPMNDDAWVSKWGESPVSCRQSSADSLRSAAMVGAVDLTDSVTTEERHKKKLVQFDDEDTEENNGHPPMQLPSQVPPDISPPKDQPKVLPDVVESLKVPDAADTVKTCQDEPDGCESWDVVTAEQEPEQEKDGGKTKRARLDINREMARAQKPNKESKPIWKMSVRELLASTKFDNFIGSIILLNAVTIGAQTDFTAQRLTDNVPSAFKNIDLVFCLIFSTELSLRFYVFKMKFLTPCGEGWLWNYFDTFVVVAQLLEYAMELAANASSLDAGQIKQMRVLRVLRLLRILRVVRVLHLISELRTIVSSIVGSFKSLGWTVCLLLLMIYIVAIFFTQSITENFVELGRTDPESMNEDEASLRLYFGSLGRAVLTLWQAMSGGLDWDTLAGPLLHELGFFTSLLFASYIAFAILALMNVVTGVFVQTALNSAKEEEESFMTDQIVSLFHIGETAENENASASSAEITLDQIIGSLEDPSQAKEWNAIGVAAEEARYVFTLLDIEESGRIPFQEFLGGCLRINGPAKSLDVLTVMQEARKNHECLLDELDTLKKNLAIMDCDAVGGLSGQGKMSDEQVLRAIDRLSRTVRTMDHQQARLHGAVDEIRSTLKNLRLSLDFMTNGINGGDSTLV
eukprot:TRINITY_DN24498_c0_g3_i1.p1 TRINITY_DN24498_c0_g3~~TRINITY_DN24498_c0_g3_i1.p1  ORF type:complete len:819 (+),score=173.22 TRINITY_DN24498_c0_g3_i1:126-2582(+)